MLIMCAILIAETLIEPKSRLSWPYGDLVPGGYIAKVSLPVFNLPESFSNQDDYLKSITIEGAKKRYKKF